MKVDLLYSPHRPEMLELSHGILSDKDVIILEEPPHPTFLSMLDGDLPIEHYIFELDLEFPEFSRRQYTQLRDWHAQGKIIMQIEPFMEHLLQIHHQFSNGSGPDDLIPQSLHHRIYLCEKEATKALLHYYKAVQTGDFTAILDAIIRFAQADGARFRLRDILRAKEILRHLDPRVSMAIEAGPIHVLLGRLLESELSPTPCFEIHHLESLALRQIGKTGALRNPGDELTINSILQQQCDNQHLQLLAARSLIYAKIITKEETTPTTEPFPHTENEHRVITLINHLNIAHCKELFSRIRTLPTKEAFDVVKQCLAL